MKERPILFNGEMVRAILAGHKTQTRRPIRGLGNVWHVDRLLGDWPLSRDPEPTPTGSWEWRLQTDVDDYADFRMNCPFGIPGDRLWVRETWAHYQTIDAIRSPDGRYRQEVSDGLAGYRADGCDTIEEFRSHVSFMSDFSPTIVVINGDKWRPSIHMPRWASRITLEVTGVRVERVQEISESDAQAEGIARGPYGVPGRFADTWNDLYAKKGLGWDVNPYVWVVEFRMVSA